MDEKRNRASRTKWTRKSGRKVKSGCLTCKIRRKKCDETKPACTRCLETGRTCDFVSQASQNYPVDVTTRSTNLQHQASYSSHLCPPNLSYPLSYMSISQQDLCHYHCFRDICQQEFSSYFEISIWQSIALQVASIEPCILHGLIAVGSLSQLRDPRSYLSTRQINVTMLEYPLKRYNMAIRTLNERLDTSSDGWLLAVLGSLLFISFELLMGRQDVANMHMQSAFKILKDLHVIYTPCPVEFCDGRINYPPNRSLGPNFLRSSSSEIDTLICAFSQLDVQASSFKNMYKVMPIRIPTIPLQFSSLNSAWKTLNAITTAVYCLIEQSGEDTRTLPQYPLPPHIVEQKTQMFSSLIAWRDTFNNFIKDDSRSRRLASEKTKAGIDILSIHQLVSWVRLSSYFYSSPIIYDSFISEFALIVKHAEAILEFDQFQAQQHQPAPRFEPCVILDIVLVQPLFFVAVSCRHPKLRRQAIDVMAKVRREQVKDVALLAQVAMWIVEQEEKEQRSLLSTIYIREESRFRIIEIEFLAGQGRKLCKAVGKRWTGESGLEECYATFN